ncbi:tetratricopeptide repeat protein [Nonomuraea maritima]|uniref:tetratricopeptide repeat protein n=1 Tax=Nonomuraea maritima TaxID=683260 RepID=UPI0037219B20
MTHDQQGLAMTGAGAVAARHYDRAIDHLLHFRAEVAGEADAALAESPDFPMGNVLAAYLRLLTTEAADARAARTAFLAFLRRADESRLDPRERAHVAAVRALLDGDLLTGAARLAELTVAYPRDVLALAAGHQLDFLTGDARMLRDRIGGALNAWHEDDPHYGRLLGMYAFGLEEAGHYDRSEEVGLRAVELDRRDVWGVHAVVHTYEMQGRFGDGLRYLDARMPDWSAGTFFNVHTWWHYCLYALEAGEEARVTAVHDAVMSYVGAGRFGAAERLIAGREAYALEPRPGVTNRDMTLRVGLPVCRAILAFGRGDHEAVVDLLYPLRHRVNEFGGSHAQRDAVQRTLLESALRAGRLDLARVLVSERVNLRPCSPYNWLKQAALARAAGDHAAAAAARTHATHLTRASGSAPEEGRPPHVTGTTGDKERGSR